MINIIYRLVAPKFFEEAIEEINIDNVIVRPSYLSICQADKDITRVKEQVMFLKKNYLWL